MPDDDPLIQGWRIDRRLLQSYSLRRCELGECRAWCCGLGVWVDVEESRRIRAQHEMVAPYLPAARRDAARWFLEDDEDDPDFPSGRCIGTATVDRPDHPLGMACIFLREDFRCALQLAGVENGMGRWGLKPFYCALHPLTTGADRRLTLDDDNEVYIGGGSCQRVVAPWSLQPLYEVMADEITLLLGEHGYRELVALARNGGPAG